MVEAVPILRIGLLRDSPFRSGVAQGRSIYEINVQTSVVVVIEQGNSCPHGFEQVFSRSMRCPVLKVDAEPLRCVDEGFARIGSYGCRWGGTLCCDLSARGVN